MRNHHGQSKKQQPGQNSAPSPIAKPEKHDSAKEQSVGDKGQQQSIVARPRSTAADWWSVGIEALAALLLAGYTCVNYNMFQAMVTSNKTTAKLIELARQAESPGFSVARATPTIDGKDLKMMVWLKNSGKGVAKIRQVRWVIASERAYWNKLGTNDAPDSTILGPGDTHPVQEIFYWASPEALKADAAVGVRVYIMIDYVDPMKEKLTAVVCQHYDSLGGIRDCFNAGPD